jgi:5-histidylcysteine sulfoxide synthase/putative 4-mercaptohistidine N1-methyltranferase
MADGRNPNLGLLPSRAPASADGWLRNLGRSRLNLNFPKDQDWWTGKLPLPGQCPGVGEDNKISALPTPNLKTCTRQEVLDYFDNGWTLTETLFSSLIGEEAFYRPPYHGLRHPMAFYYTHPAALYVNKLRVAELIEVGIHPDYERLFETGVDEMSWDDMTKNEFEWPAIDDLKSYRRQVYELVSTLINSHPGLADGHRAIGPTDQLWALFMSFEHERIHIETSSVLIRELPLDLVRRPNAWPVLHPSVKAVPTEVKHPRKGQEYPANEFVSVPAGQVVLGKPAEWPTFGWDNEYGLRQDLVSAFEVSRQLTSNGEFWQFVADGGYLDERYWSDAGWRWRSFRNVKWPTFWYPIGPSGSNRFELRTCFELIAMPWSWPVLVNYHEAQAYCRWRAERDGSAVAYRLITESEHSRMRQAVGYSAQDEPASQSPVGNLNLRWGSESPVDSQEDQPICDVFGNAWQWCEDHFNPLPNFRVHRYYDDFSTPCYDGQHQMILGGSFASTGDEASSWARFHFRPHFFQQAGFRVAYCVHGGDGGAVKIGDTADTVNPYETEQSLAEYLTLHFCAADSQMPFAFGPVDATRFPVRCAELAIDWCRRLDIPTERALDLGCSVGGASFALGEVFNQVEAVDLSEQFIETAKRIQRLGEISFRCKEEGELFSSHSVFVPPAARKAVNFRRADACSLPAEYHDFDAVLLGNLLCRLPSPMACLSRLGGMRGIVRKGGLLVVTTPFTWMERFTPRDVWLGGFFTPNGQPVHSEDRLLAVLGADFELLEKKDMPLVIKEHSRKYQYIVALATVWRRISD